MKGQRGKPAEIECCKLLEAFKKSGLSKYELAKRVGWMRAVPDVSRVSRALGLQRMHRGRYCQRVAYSTGLRLAKAMNADLQELGA